MFRIARTVLILFLAVFVCTPAQATIPNPYVGGVCKDTPTRHCH